MRPLHSKATEKTPAIPYIKGFKALVDLMKKTGVRNLKFDSALWGLKRIILQMSLKKY